MLRNNVSLGWAKLSLAWARLLTMQIKVDLQQMRAFLRQISAVEVCSALVLALPVGQVVFAQQ